MTLRQSPRADWVAAHDRMEDLIVLVPEWTKPCRLVGQQHDRSPHVMPVHPGSCLDKLVAGQMIDEVVESEVSRRHGAEVAIGDCRPAGADNPLASLPICSRGIFRSRDGRCGIQSCPELIELTRKITIDPRDYKTASTTFYQEALLVQLLQGLMPGLAGDTKPLCHVILNNSRVWRHEAVTNCLADHFVDRLPNLLPRLDLVHFGA
jgi:hypothetical protein